MAESVTPAEKPEPTVPEAPPPPVRRGWRRLARFGLLAGLFLLAIVASWIIREQVREEEQPPASHGESPKSHGKKIQSAGSPVETLARGDEALERHCYSEALSHYEEVLAGAPAAAPLVDYRLGLRHESVGRLDQAIAFYRKA